MAIPVPLERAWSRAARTSNPRMICVCVRKNGRGTVRQGMSTVAIERPKASRTAKSASIGAAIMGPAELSGPVRVLKAQSLWSHRRNPHHDTSPVKAATSKRPASGQSMRAIVTCLFAMGAKFRLIKGKSMRKLLRCTFVAVVLGGFVGTSALAFAADRTAADILKDLEGVTLPKFDPAKRSDQAYVQQYITEHQKVAEKRGELILELLKVAPDHEQIPKLLTERWTNLPAIGPKADDSIKEIEETMAHTKNEKVKVEGTFTKAGSGSSKEPFKRETRHLGHRRVHQRWPPRILAAAICCTWPPVSPRMKKPRPLSKIGSSRNFRIPSSPE